MLAVEMRGWKFERSFGAQDGKYLGVVIMERLEVKI